MPVYWDTSALVKLYVDEPGHSEMNRLFEKADLHATSMLAYAETVAAFGRMARTNRISVDSQTLLAGRFDADWPRLAHIPAEEELVRKAGALAVEHALRAYDAVHLASADQLRSASAGETIAACFDKRLSNALASCGFRLA